MSTKVKASNQDRIRFLERELARYRSFVISLAGQDAEGTYRPEFVRRIRDAAGERPSAAFRSAAQFLRDLRRV